MTTFCPGLKSRSPIGSLLRSQDATIVKRVAMGRPLAVGVSWKALSICCEGRSPFPSLAAALSRRGKQPSGTLSRLMILAAQDGLNLSRCRDQLAGLTRRQCLTRLGLDMVAKPRQIAARLRGISRVERGHVG